MSHGSAFFDNVDKNNTYVDKGLEHTRDSRSGPQSNQLHLLRVADWCKYDCAVGIRCHR